MQEPLIRPPRLAPSRKFVVGVGDFGLNLYWQVASLYLLYFYTDVLLLPPAVAGAIYMAALVWDAILDPAIGLVIDRTRSRWGRYRPYLLGGPPLLALAFAGMFVIRAAPAPETLTLAIVTHFAFRTLYAGVSVPYAALTARLTQDVDDRADITAVRMVSATIAAILVATGTLFLAQRFGGGRVGWGAVAAVYAVAATAVLLVVAAGIRGLDMPTARETSVERLRDKIAVLRFNTPLLLVLGAVAATSFSQTIFQKSLLYYFKYEVGNEQLGGLALGFCALVTALFVPVWAAVAKRHGKRLSWLCGLLPTIMGLCGWHVVDGQDVPILFAPLGLLSIGTAAYVVSFWAMVPDTVEYSEWRTGIRAESLAFGLLMLGQKAALGLGAGFLGLMLSYAGYTADMRQSEDAMAAIGAMMFWIPFVSSLLTAWLIASYPITPALYRHITDELSRRRHGVRD